MYRDICFNRFYHLLIVIILLVVGIICWANCSIEVHAEEIQIFCEKNGDLEQLKGIELSETEMEEGVEYSKNSTQRDARLEENNEVEYSILNYGSDYGYQDMIKRSNPEARQFLYRQLESGCRKFTTSETNAGTVTTSSGKSYPFAFEVDLAENILSSNEKLEVYFTFRHDNPQFFWLSNTVVYSSGKVIVLTYDDYKSGLVRKATFDEIINTIENIYMPQTVVSDTSYLKTLAIHDALIKEIDYSYDTSIETAHSVAGALTSQKSAVCEGYAKTMQLLMSSCGVENIYITGYANGGHAWNLVRMSDRQYYWLDATWDDQANEIYRHKYFLVGNENFTDHIVDTPEGTGTSFLYELPLVSDKDYDPDSTTEVFYKGDINKDGIINLFDLVMCLNHISQKTILNDDAQVAADMNKDGNINLFDLIELLNVIA